jgi:hypothetical protein
MKIELQQLPTKAYTLPATTLHTARYPLKVSPANLDLDQDSYSLNLDLQHCLKEKELLNCLNQSCCVRSGGNVIQLPPKIQIRNSNYGSGSCSGSLLFW